MERSNALRFHHAILAASFVALSVPHAAGAANIAQTPHYSHALHQLTFSRYALSVSGDTVTEDQKRALSNVDRAIAALKSAGVADPNDLAANERAVSTRTQQDRFNLAVNAIYSARFDVTHYSELDATHDGWRSQVTSDLSSAETSARAAAAASQAAVAPVTPVGPAGPVAPLPVTNGAGTPGTVAANGSKSKGGFRPSYLYAIRDLDYADKLLSSPEVTSDADVQAALADIRSASGSFKQAAIDDGRDLNGKANVDANMSHMDRLHAVLALLHQVRTDVSRRETNAAASDVESGAISHVDSATEHVKSKIARNDAGKR